MNEELVLKRLQTEEDFIALKRFGFSVAAILDRYPEGVPDRLIAQALCLSEAEVETRYQQLVLKLRHLMKVDAQS